MNKKNVLELLLEKYRGSNKINKQIIKELEETILEMQVAQAMFDEVSDSKLVEVAIYKEQVAKKRFEYLLSIAKEKGINR